MCMRSMKSRIHVPTSDVLVHFGKESEGQAYSLENLSARHLPNTTLRRCLMRQEFIPSLILMNMNSCLPLSVTGLTSQVREPQIALSDYKNNTGDTNQEGFTGSMKISSQVIGPSLKVNLEDLEEDSVEKVGS